jgi:hypothetical protein
MHVRARLVYQFQEPRGMIHSDNLGQGPHGSNVFMFAQALGGGAN